MRHTPRSRRSVVASHLDVLVGRWRAQLANGPAKLFGLGALLQLLALGADPRAQERFRGVVASQRPRDERQPAALAAALGSGSRRHDGREPRDLGGHVAIIASGGYRAAGSP